MFDVRDRYHSETGIGMKLIPLNKIKVKTVFLLSKNLHANDHFIFPCKLIGKFISCLVLPSLCFKIRHFRFTGNEVEQWDDSSTVLGTTE